MGFDTDRFASDLKDELICLICQEVLEDPMECSECQTNFCLSCITLWKTKSDLCPNRCKLNLQRSHKFLRSVLDNLPIFCIFKREGCQEISRLDSISNHETNHCKYRETKCKYENCLEKRKAYEIFAHEEECLERLLICEECKIEITIKDLKNHSCIVSLSGKLNSLNQKVNIRDSKLYELKEKFNENLYHFGVKCNNCAECPIKGVRYVCLNCPEFSLCRECFERKKHPHNEFYNLYFAGYHERVTCDGCDINPLPGLRFKCKICDDFGNVYEDFCLKCKVTRGHPHTDFFIWDSYHLTVYPITLEKMTYHTGETLVRGWSIYNSGHEVLTNFSLLCIEGNSCCNLHLANFNCYDFGHIEIKPKESGTVYVREKITEQRPGVYKSEWRLVSNDRLSSFGPKLFIELVLIN